MNSLRKPFCTWQLVLATRRLTFSCVVKFTSTQSGTALAAEKKGAPPSDGCGVSVSEWRPLGLHRAAWGLDGKGKEHLVCKLRKSLYGLKHAVPEVLEPQARGVPMHHWLHPEFSWPLYLCEDWCLLGDHCSIRRNGSVKWELSSRFKMKDMDELHFILGMEVKHDKSRGRIKAWADPVCEVYTAEIKRDGSKTQCQHLQTLVWS